MLIYIRALMVTLAFSFVGATNQAYGNPSINPKAESIFFRVSDSPQVAFTIPIKSSVQITLRTNKNAKSDSNIVARIRISDQGCDTGHQASIIYKKNKTDFMTAYFPKEIPWGATYKLSVIRNSETKEVTAVINDQSISIVPTKHAIFMQIEPTPDGITLVNTDHQNK